MLSFRLELARSYARSHPNLLKYKPRYDLQSKMSWHSDFKSFTDNLFPCKHRGNKFKISDPENEAKQNQYEFPGASSIIKCFENFDKIFIIFYKQVFINLFVHFSRKVYAFISILHKMFLLSYCSMIW